MYCCYAATVILHVLLLRCYCHRRIACVNWQLYQADLQRT
jgi:hypothetical protein